MKELYLITGFLGTGKTTFLNTASKTFTDKRIAIIVNEFGKQGVDGSLLSEKGYEVTEISNGSVFCVCRMDMFIDALIQASQTSAGLLLVETSGLSNPTNIYDILAQTRKVSGVSFDYKGCVCLVDAVNFEKVYTTAVVIPYQIKQASLVVVNKIDLATPDKIEKIKSLIKTLNPFCAIYQTTYANIPMELLVALKPINERVKGGKQDLLSGSLTFKVASTIGIGDFRKLVEDIKPLVYRCKGYITLSDGTYFIDGVMSDISILRVDGVHPNGIVLLYKTSRHVRKELERIAKDNGIIIEILE